VKDPSVSAPSVIGKYQVTRQLAQGGMGTLYLAHDPVLDRLVAIKVIRGDFDDPALRERFIHEAQSISRLRHPNIVTIFEYGEFSGQPFIAMEYIVGESVGDIIRRHAPLSLARKLQIMDELCAGMACAHRAKVVHRDLKPDNIMVDAEASLVKIVDFGIARSLQTNVSRFTQGIGTPNYMAPEQFMGQMDYRSDIYAIGAVCYELLSYQQAFGGESAFAVIGKIVLEKPAPLAEVCPDVDRAIIDVVNKALEKEPSQRYQDLDAMRADIKRVAASLVAGDTAAPTREIGEPPGAPPALLTRAVRSWSKKWTAAAVAAILLGLGWGARGWLRSNERSVMPSATGSSARIRQSVAVLGFKNLSGRADAAWLSTALGEMLTTELSAGERLRAIPGENVARMKIELTLADADSFARDTLKRIRRNIGTDVVLVGSYVAIGAPGSERIRLDLRLQDTAAGDTIAVVSDTAPEADLLELVTRTGARIRDRLGVGELSSGEAASVQASLPSTPEATRLYAEGLRKLRVYDNLAARTYFERALVADPNSPLTYAGLAAAWSALGYDPQAAAAASKAFEQSGKLSREDRLSIEGRFREIRREWDQAIRVYRALLEFFPDNVEYGLRLAAALESSGRGKDALATLDGLRAVAGAGSSEPRIDVAESSVALSLSDFKRALAAALRAGAKAEQQGARLLVAEARLQEGTALINLGELAKAPRALEEGKTIFVDAGDRAAAARASNLIAVVLARRGDLDASRHLFEQTLSIYREIGNAGGVAHIQSNLGNVHSIRGELRDAVKEWENALAVYRQLNQKEGIARTQNNIGDALRRRGDPAANERFEEALTLWREIGRRRDAAIALDNLAALRYDAGDLAGARRLAEEALAIYKEVGDKSELGFGLRNVASILRAQGDLVGARSRQEQALASQEQSGGKTDAAVFRQDLARTALEQGHLAEAETLARAAATELRDEKLGNEEGAAEAVLADALLSQGKLDDARSAIRQATELIRKSENRRDYLYVRIVAARVLAASGKSAEAERSLQAVVTEAEQMHLIDRELEARLGLGEIELTSGKAAAGQKRLTDLGKQAAEKGFGLIARKAAAAGHKSP
jgi:tetratricopeptide (TPR) repeat protein/TolB-like protein